MATGKSRAAGAAVRRLKGFQQEYRALRAKAGILRREELALLRRLAAVARPHKAAHLKTVEHRSGRKDRITHHPLRGPASLTAAARARGSSGLLCGCSPIIIKRQPNDDIDICILIDCSNDPQSAGFRCHYWCSTIVAPPIVGIARRQSRRVTRAHPSGAT